MTRAGRRARPAAWLVAAAVAAAAPAAAEELTFAVVGHPRGEATGEPYYRLDELVRELAKAEPDLLFLTGDSIWGDYNDARVDRAGILADWEALDAALAPLGIPVHRVPGNHDVNDPVTRDVWLERYGPLPRAVRHGDVLFLLLSSVPFPEGDGPPALPRANTRVEALPPGQLEFLREVAEEPADWEHAFVFLHHLLWWKEDAPWWEDVHPLLGAARVRAVFGGDYGPLKFSHVRRDGVDYLQAALEGPSRNTRLLRALEGSRVLHVQLDPFLLVRVDGPSVEVDVRMVGATSSGKLTPARYREIFGPQPPTWRERVDRALGGPLRRALLAGVLAASFAGGFLLGRRRRAAA